MNNLQALQYQLETLKDQLESYKHDPMRHDDLADAIKKDHDQALWENYASALDALPFYTCGRGVSTFADFVAECDPSFYSQSLNDFADSYDVENLDEYKDLESQIEDLEIEIENLENND